VNHKEKYMICNIKDVGRGRVSMSIDENTEKEEFEVGAKMLFIPDIGEDASEHVIFDIEQATALRDWLDNFLTTPNLGERLTDGKET